MSEARIDLLTDQLRQRMQSGEFGTGGHLPPHRALAIQLRTSCETTNKVLQHLLAEGLLVSQGRSIYVAPPRVRLPGIISHYQRYMQEQGVLPIRVDGGSHRCAWNTGALPLFGVVAVRWGAESASSVGSGSGQRRAL